MARKPKTWQELVEEARYQQNGQSGAESLPRAQQSLYTPRVQYTAPMYQGNSASKKTYNWETEMLKDVKIKGATSYNAKFEAITAQMGMSPGEAEDYRRFLDFQEDSQPQTVKYNKDGTINQSQKLNFARGGNTVNGMIDEIIGNARTKGLKDFREANEQEKYMQFKKPGTMDKIKHALGMNTGGLTPDKMENARIAKELGLDISKPITKEEFESAKATKSFQASNQAEKERDGFLGFLDSTLGRASDAAMNAVPFVGKDVVEGRNQNYADLAISQLEKDPTDQGAIQALQALNTTTREADGVLEKGADLAGMMSTELAMYLSGYGLLDKGLKAAKGIKGASALANAPKMVQDLARGATVGTGIGAIRAGSKDYQAENPEDFEALDYLKTIGLEASLAGGGDALVGGVLRNLNLKGLTKGLSDDVANQYAQQIGASTGRTPEQIKLAMRESITPKNVLADPPASDMPEPFENKFSQLSQPKTMDNFTGEVPAVDTTPTDMVMDDFFNFAQSGQGSQARGAQAKVTAPRYEAENISNLGDDILGRLDKLNNKPKGYYNQRILEVQQAMKQNKNLTPEQTEALEQAQKVWDQRQQYEDAFVEQELAPYMESQQQSAQAQQQWEGIVKQAKQELDRIKGTYGKIVPDGISKDAINEIPPQFRGARGSNGDDIYKFADQEGFANADEAILYLKQLDADSKIKLKDIDPGDGMKISEEQWKKLDEAARKKFAETDEGKAIDNLFVDSLEAGRASNFDELYAANKGTDDPETFEELVRLAQMDLNGKPMSKDLKTLLREDPKISQSVKALNELLGAKKTSAPTQEAPKELDEILRFLDEAPTKPGRNETTDRLVSLLRNEPEPVKEIVNNSQTVDSALDTSVRPTSNPESDFEPLMRLNMQTFNDTATDNSMFSYNTSEVSKVADEMNILEKGYEGLVSSNHKFQVLSKNLLKKNASVVKENYKKQIQAAKDVGRVEEAKRLTKELKSLYGAFGRVKGDTDLLKAAQTEQAAYLLVDDLIKSTYGQAESILNKAKISVADAWEYQAAKNLDWFMKKGGHGEYQLPKGWDEGRLVDVINKWKNNEAMASFSEAINTIRETRLDYLQRYGLKSTDEFTSLSQNPHYIPMMKDFDWKKSSIEAAMRKTSDVGKTTPNVMALGKGSEEFFSNPVESLVGATYTSVRNALRNGTSEQFAKLADLDVDGVFIRPTKEAASYDGNVIEHYADGIVQNYAISPDLADVIRDLRSSDKGAGIAEKVTGIIGSLKTTSTAYQLKAIPRDWGQYIVNSDGNPLKNVWDLLGTVAHPKKSMKYAMKEGGAFHNAYKDSMGSYRTTQEMARNFVKANRLKGGKDVVADKKSIKNVAKTILKVVTPDYQIGAALGNFGDTAPRVAALKQVEREFMPAIQELEQAVANATDDFTRQTLQSDLNQLKTKFQREKIYRSRDVINYQRSGNSKYAKFIKQYWNFANTATQSVDRYFRQVAKKPISTITKTLALSAPMMGLQEMAYQNASEEDKKTYDDTPDFLKNTMYVFMVDGHRVMIPKPFEVALITSPIEALINTTHSYDEEDLKQKTKDGVTHAVRELVPLEIGDMLTGNFGAFSAYQPIDEIKNNRKSLNGKPISYFDEYESNTPKSDFFLEEGTTVDDVGTDFTSPTSKAISEMAGTNPDYLEHAIKGYGGDQGKNTLAILDALLGGSDEWTKKATQTLNPLQDFFNSKNGSYAWKNAYTEKSKEK